MQLEWFLFHFKFVISINFIDMSLLTNNYDDLTKKTTSKFFGKRTNLTITLYLDVAINRLINR